MVIECRESKLDFGAEPLPSQSLQEDTGGDSMEEGRSATRPYSPVSTLELGTEPPRSSASEPSQIKERKYYPDEGREAELRGSGTSESLSLERRARQHGSGWKRGADGHSTRGVSVRRDRSCTPSRRRSRTSPKERLDSWRTSGRGEHPDGATADPRESADWHLRGRDDRDFVEYETDTLWGDTKVASYQELCDAPPVAKLDFAELLDAIADAGLRRVGRPLVQAHRARAQGVQQGAQERVWALRAPARADAARGLYDRQGERACVAHSRLAIHIHTSPFTFTPHQPKGRVATRPFGDRARFRPRSNQRALPRPASHNGHLRTCLAPFTRFWRRESVK